VHVNVADMLLHEKTPLCALKNRIAQEVTTAVFFSQQSNVLLRSPEEAKWYRAVGIPPTIIFSKTRVNDFKYGCEEILTLDKF